MNSELEHNIESRDIYSVTRLNREVRAVLEGSFPPIWVQGEISNLARPGSGHLYFSLKDKNSQVRCAMFRNRNRFLKFAPENGMEILVKAEISLYEGRGEFQLIVENMEPAGEGALQRAFEELKQRLQKEGLFDEGHKKSLPLFPKNIGVITSPSGAAIRDVLTVLKRRYPQAGVIIYPVPVQGEQSAVRIAEMIALADKRKECEVFILTRGGGSLEDLQAFNEEIVARAVYQCKTPIVCGVGHEIDFSIADFIADQRAATPSAAAELVSPDHMTLQKNVLNLESKLQNNILNLLQKLQYNSTQLGKRLPHPARQLQNQSQRLDDIGSRMMNTIRSFILMERSTLGTLSANLAHHNPLHLLRRLFDKSTSVQEQMKQNMHYQLKLSETRLANISHALNTVSPLATLERGYSITLNKNENVIRKSNELNPGDSIKTRFAKGTALSTVTNIKDE